MMRTTGSDSGALVVYVNRKPGRDSSSGDTREKASTHWLYFYCQSGRFCGLPPYVSDGTEPLFFP
ncbi:hypothetical protein BDW75DRAFT_48529 [Aspergillus navahoensis]